MKELDKRIFQHRRNLYEEEDSPKPTKRELLKEELIAALVKELGAGKDKEKRIRKIVNRFL